ncbi:MAG: alpha/beta fold hydrolase [Bdellovibrionota bacterium]
MAGSASTIAFKLSDPGTSLAQDPAMMEYLRSYDFPCPPDVRYGYARLESPHAKDRVTLFGQAWVPYHPIGTVAVFHGYGEHGGNYARLVRDFIDNRFAVVMMDLRGHGLSEGPRGHAPSPEIYAEDWAHFLSNVFPMILPNLPFYVWGHSLGALVALQLLKKSSFPVKPRAVVLSSPLLGFPVLKGMQKLLAKLAPTMAKFLPSFPIAHGISPSVLSHDEEYLARRFEDPLIGKVSTPLWFLSMKEAVKELQASPEAFQTISPTLLLLAGNELVTNLNDARKFAFRAYSGMTHKVIEFPGYYHELEKEKEIRARVVSESVGWFKNHQ